MHNYQDVCISIDIKSVGILFKPFQLIRVSVHLTESVSSLFILIWLCSTIHWLIFHCQHCVFILCFQFSFLFFRDNFKINNLTVFQLEYFLFCYVFLLVISYIFFFLLILDGLSFSESSSNITENSNLSHLKRKSRKILRWTLFFIPEREKLKSECHYYPHLAASGFKQK